MSAIFVNASLVGVMPLIPAGSAGGPTTRNMLCISSWRFTPNPPSMSVFSAAGEWTISTSALPSSPSLSAAPLPTATVFTLQAVAASKAGTRTSRSPESWVEVVVARMRSPEAAGDAALEATGVAARRAATVAGAADGAAGLAVQGAARRAGREDRDGTDQECAPNCARSDPCCPLSCSPS